MNKNQPDLFEAEVSWFHFLRDMIQSKEIARLGDSAVKVYLVIKSFANWSDGRSFPSMDTISEYSGKSIPSVERAVSELIEAGLILKEKRGRHNEYKLREKVEIKDLSSGDVIARASFEYIPLAMRSAMSDLKQVLLSPTLEGAKMIHIENLQINIHTGSGSINAPTTQPSVSVIPDEFAKLDPKLQKLLKGLNPET